jgi:hypothetical protein
MKKHTLPSSDMNGNDPVRSWYTMPSFLSANAPNPNTFAIDPSLLSTIRVGCRVLYSDELLSKNITDVCSELSLILSTGCIGTVMFGICVFGRVVFNSWCGAFYPMAGPFHMSLRCSWTWVQIFQDQLQVNIRAPIKESLRDGFQHCRKFWIAQRLMCKFYRVHSRFD